MTVKRPLLMMKKTMKSKMDKETEVGVGVLQVAVGAGITQEVEGVGALR